ncbi:MAG: carboxypeptidase-like regulatory domain-containing protein [Bacteroides sp.]|nr:carboxypeptidase-like regulatory domain-containing protein [Bacteroides sp.]
MRVFVLLWFFSISFLSVFCQHHTLTGAFLTDDPADSIIGNVYLMDKENVLVKYAVVEEGYFSMKEVLSGEYTLVASCFGFEKKRKS